MAITSTPPLLPLPALPYGPDVDILFKAAKAGNLASLQQAIDHPANASYWGTPHGRFVLRYLASCSANHCRWDTVAYFCEVRGVPVDAVRAEDGLWQMPGIPVEVLAKVDSQMTPLIGAICGSKEDLAMFLLRLPGQVPGQNRCIDGVQSKELVRQGADMATFFPTRLCVQRQYIPTYLYYASSSSSIRHGASRSLNAR